MPRIADTRKLTLASAEDTFEVLARAQVRIWKRQAAFDDRVAALKSKLEADNAEDADVVRAAGADLAEFILANKDLFKKPRKIRTAFGTFGLEAECELVFEDEEALLQALLDRGYDDCQKVTRAILKRPVTDRIKAGEALPGCRILEGDVAKYKVDRSLADDAPAAEAAAQ